MHDIGTGNRFGLDLPPGDYDIVVFSDRNDNGTYESTEVIGRNQLSLSAEDYPSMVVTRYVVELGQYSAIDWPTKIAAKKSDARQQSLFFPAGTLRDLSDPIFAAEMSTLGLYDPAAFFDRVSTPFFALEDDIDYKIPVIFVHGIGGSPRDFQALVAQLDRSRFKAWFFYYPSGGDLNQLAELFQALFLSGDNNPINELVPMVIVAHSMGGLIVREAFNTVKPGNPGLPTIEFISLATPFGGDPSARLSNDRPTMTLPSWRDLNPDNEFVQQLYRKPLTDPVHHHLFFAFNNAGVVKLGTNSDGVVPVASQLALPAQRQAGSQLGFDVTHAGILSDRDSMGAVGAILANTQTGLPQAHLAYLRRSGFDVDAGERFSPRDQYYLKHYGRYLQALAQGKLQPLNARQQKLQLMLRGQTTPPSEIAAAWLKYSPAL
jgi:pimeloyl-ACP methyl ester carboxylesterase